MMERSNKDEAGIILRPWKPLQPSSRVRRTMGKEESRVSHWSDSIQDGASFISIFVSSFQQQRSSQTSQDVLAKNPKFNFSKS